jgi:hypothetical protein
LFRGSNGRLEFISDYSLADGAGDFRKIDYAVDGGRFLYAEKTLFDYEPAEVEDPPTEVLATFNKVSFHFLGKDQQDQPAWLDEWKLGMGVPPGVPPAIQVQIDGDTFTVRAVNR